MSGTCTWWPRVGTTLARSRLYFQAEDGIRDLTVTGVQTCALPIYPASIRREGCWRRADSGKIGIGSRGRWPQVEQWLDAGNGGGTGCEIGHKGGGGLVKVLAEAFVVGEQKSLIDLDRATTGAPKLIALKGRRSPAIEEEIGRASCRERV